MIGLFRTSPPTKREPPSRTDASFLVDHEDPVDFDQDPVLPATGPSTIFNRGRWFQDAFPAGTLRASAKI